MSLRARCEQSRIYIETDMKLNDFAEHCCLGDQELQRVRDNRDELAGSITALKKQLSEACHDTQRLRQDRNEARQLYEQAREERQTFWDEKTFADDRARVLRGGET
jgi:chromosome segregation ATPase